MSGFDLGPNPDRVVSNPKELAKILKNLTVRLADTQGDLDDVSDGTSSLAFTPTERTKLSGIETGATADQTDSEIVSAFESQTGLTTSDLVEDDSAVFSNPPRVPSYTVAGAPSASTYSWGLIGVTNETGGAVLAFSDGTNWRRVTDRAIIS